MLSNQKEVGNQLSIECYSSGIGSSVFRWHDFPLWRSESEILPGSPKHSPKEGHTPLLGGEAEGLACGLHHFSCSGFILEALGSKKFPQFVLFLRQDWWRKQGKSLRMTSIFTTKKVRETNPKALSLQRLRLEEIKSKWQAARWVSPPPPPSHLTSMPVFLLQ